MDAIWLSDITSRHFLKSYTMVFSTDLSRGMFLTVLLIIMKNENSLKYIRRNQLNDYTGICSHHRINIEWNIFIDINKILPRHIHNVIVYFWVKTSSYRLVCMQLSIMWKHIEKKAGCLHLKILTVILLGNGTASGLLCAFLYFPR